MKIHIDRLVLILFVLAMFFFMTVSAQAQTGNSHFFNQNSFNTENKIELTNITMTRSYKYAGVKDDSPQTIFGKDCPYYIYVDNNEDNHSTTDLEFYADKQGVLLVYYVRNSNAVINSDEDLTLDSNKGGVVDNDKVIDSYNYGVKYFIVNSGDHSLSSYSTCKVYGFVFMPGNVAAYNVLGKGDLDLIGRSCDSYINLKKPRQAGNWYFEGWYEDSNYQTEVTNSSFSNPSVIYAKWLRCVWDFQGISSNSRSDYFYDGMNVVNYINENDKSTSTLSNKGFTIYNQKSTVNGPYISFVPQYDGYLTVTYNSYNNQENGDNGNNCIIGTALPTEANIDGNQLASGQSSLRSEVKTLQTKLEKGNKYFIYTTTGNIQIKKLQYTQIDQDEKVSLTTTDNMQGWRAFYDAVNSYTADLDTKVYIVEQSEADGKVMFVNRTGQTIPAGCPVVLHTEYKNDGSYTISLEKVSLTDGYTEAVGGNLLSVSEAGVSVNAYRLGYKAGEDFGVAFYKWSSDNPNAGIVYLDKNKLKNNSESAKIAFDIEEDVSTGVISIPNQERANNKVYSLSGQQLTAPVKGVNIFNGKKIVVR